MHDDRAKAARATCLDGSRQESPPHGTCVEQNIKQLIAIRGNSTSTSIYTRDKNWQPNIYTKASKSAPINNIRDLFYKITKVYDNYEVVSYSTGSTPSYSSVSYDNQGSFFDLDMTLLEPNNAYEISFLLKDGSDYIEQPEKFRFRVSP